MHLRAELQADGFAVTYINRACAGAVMEDYFNKRHLENHELENCPNPFADELLDENADSSTCDRYVEAQKNSITNDVDLVVMTFSENDLKFSTIVMNCFVEGMRTAAECGHWINNAYEILASGKIRNDLVGVLLDVHEKMNSEGKVVLSSYPNLISEGEPYGLKIHPENAGSFDVSAAIHTVSALLHEEQRKAVEEANFESSSDFAYFFGETSDVFSGHEPDPSVNRKNSDRWMNEYFEPGVDWYEWYHPNVQGYEKWGKAVHDSMVDDSRKPRAWFGESITGKVGQPVVFDASGSFDPRGSAISSFEWDFDGDGVFDLSTDEMVISHIYSESFEGIVKLRVTSDGGTSLASANVLINNEGSTPQEADMWCELNDATGLPILADEDGQSIYCRLSETMLPKEHNPEDIENTGDGVIITENNHDLIDELVKLLRIHTSGVSPRPGPFKRKFRRIVLNIEVGNYSNACTLLDGLITLAQKREQGAENTGVYEFISDKSSELKDLLHCGQW